MHRPLTELTVKNLPFADEGQQYDCWDTTLPRFGLRIGKRTKTFILNAGKRRVSLGRYGIVTLKHARDEARRRIGTKYLPRTSPHAPVAVEWYLDAIKSERKPSTVSAYTIYLQRLPALPLHELEAQNLYAALPKGKGAANLCFSTFKAFLSWCVERGHIEANPLLRRKVPNKLQSRDRLLTDEEIAAIWIESHKHGNFGRLFRISILAGQRTGQWKQYRTLNGNIVFPPSSMKGTIEHIVPITPALKTELAGFTPLARYKPELTKLRETLPQIQDFRPHDTRRYLSSTMSKLKVPIDITETILAHKTGSRSQIQRVYDRDARIPQMLTKMRPMLRQPAFARMFGTPETKLHLFKELERGTCILIKPSKYLMGEDGTRLFGRFWIAQMKMVAQQRQNTTRKTPTFFYIDECQDYLRGGDPKIESILEQARKENIGLSLFHHYGDQLKSTELLQLLGANTATKVCGSLASSDLSRFASYLQCDPKFLQEQEPRKTFAVHVRGITKSAVSIAFPFIDLNREPRMTDAAWRTMREKNRERYGATRSPLLSSHSPISHEPIIPPRKEVKPKPEGKQEKPRAPLPDDADPDL